MKNFKPLLLSVFGSLFSAAAIVMWRAFKKEHQTATPDLEKAGVRVPDSEKATGEVYKTVGVKHVELKNLPPDLVSSGDEFQFRGKAVAAPGQHDRYNVDVKDENGKFLGNAVKNRRLSNSIVQWHNGDVFAFGKIPGGDSQETTHGIAFIPVGFTDSQIEDLKWVLDKLKERELILAKDSISSSEYLNILDDHVSIKRVISQLGINDEINFSLSKRIIPALSRQLEEEENWAGLLHLETHNDLINELSDRFAGATLRRIEKAHEMTSQ